MLQHRDLTQEHEVEQARRAVAMLLPGQKALDREDALLLFEALLAQLRLPK